MALFAQVPGLGFTHGPRGPLRSSLGCSALLDRRAHPSAALRSSRKRPVVARIPQPESPPGFRVCAPDVRWRSPLPRGGTAPSLIGDTSLRFCARKRRDVSPTRGGGWEVRVRERGRESRWRWSWGCGVGNRGGAGAGVGRITGFARLWARRVPPHEPPPKQCRLSPQR